MARYTKTEVIHAEQWDGTEARAKYLMGELAHHGISTQFIEGCDLVSVSLPPMIHFPGYHIHPTDYLVKEQLTEDSIVWSVKSAKQMASYTEEKG